MYQMFDTKAVQENISEAQTVKYGQKDMVIHKTVATERSGVIGESNYSEFNLKLKKESQTR